MNEQTTTRNPVRQGRQRRLLGLCLAAAFTLAACSDSTPARAEVVDALNESTIAPGFEQLELDAASLSAAVEDLCLADDGPSPDTLVAAQQAMTTLRHQWLQTEAYWAGPVMDRRSWAVMDWPIAADEIEALIIDPETDLDVDTIGKRIGADQRGLQAVEYVVFAPEALDDLADIRRCDYLVAVAAVMAEEAALINVDWDSYEATPEEAIDLLVNDAVFMLRAISDAELGGALGNTDDMTDTAPEADPEAIVEGFAGLSTDDLEDRLDGIEAVLDGLAPLLSDELNERLEEQVAEAIGALAHVEEPLRSALVDNHEQVAALEEIFDELEVTVATEVVSQLGVTVGFSDADGDSG